MTPPATPNCLLSFLRSATCLLAMSRISCSNLKPLFLAVSKARSSLFNFLTPPNCFAFNLTFSAYVLRSSKAIAALFFKASTCLSVRSESSASLFLS